MTVEQAPPPPGLIYILGWWREVSTAPLMSAVVLTARPRAQTGVAYIADDAGNVMYGVGVSAATDPEGRALLTLVWVEGAVYDVEFGGVKGTLRCDDWAEGSTVPFTGIRGLPGGDGIADPLTWDAVISGLNGRIAAQVPPVVATAVPAYLSAHPDIIEDAATAAGAAAGAAAAAATQLEVEARTRLLVGTSSAGDRVALAAAAADAAAAGVQLILRGDFAISDYVDLPSRARVDATAATLTQTAPLVGILRVAAGATGVRITGGRFVGLTTDYSNTSTVFRAAGVTVQAGASDAIIRDATFTGLAGCAVYTEEGSTRTSVLGCTITGPGPAWILNSTYNYSAGCRMLGTEWSVEECDITGYAQGVLTGTGQSTFRLRGNRVHDIPGQHGFYLESVAGGSVITENIVWNTGVLGMKIQIGDTDPIDPIDTVIAHNIFRNVGNQGILLTNVGTSSTRLRRIVVSDNVVDGAALDGITINNAVGLGVHHNILRGCGRHGIGVTDATGLTIDHNQIDGTAWNGILLQGVTDSLVESNRIRDPASLDYTSAEFGIQVTGASSDLELRYNNISDSAGHMRYGIYVNNGADITSLDVIGNRVSGATDYGWRSTITGAARTFWGNQLSGALGATLGPPTNWVANPDTAGGTLAALETEVNELKALLRGNRFLP